MSDARWADVFREAGTAVVHFARAVQLYNAGGFEGDTIDFHRAQMALMHSLQSAHTSLEGTLERILAILGEEPPHGERWHDDLIRRVSEALNVTGKERSAILTGDIATAADESRRFRHRTMHNYDTFEAFKAEPAIAAARIIAASLRSAIEEFKAVVDPEPTYKIT